MLKPLVRRDGTCNITKLLFSMFISFMRFNLLCNAVWSIMTAELVCYGRIVNAFNDFM